MSANFLDFIDDIEDLRIAGMVVNPLDEVLLSVLVGLLCRAENFGKIEVVCTELLNWLRGLLPFANGIAPSRHSGGHWRGSIRGSWRRRSQRVPLTASSERRTGIHFA